MDLEWKNPGLVKGKVSSGFPVLSTEDHRGIWGRAGPRPQTNRPGNESTQEGRCTCAWNLNCDFLQRLLWASWYGGQISNLAHQIKLSSFHHFACAQTWNALCRFLAKSKTHNKHALNVFLDYSGINPWCLASHPNLKGDFNVCLEVLMPCQWERKMSLNSLQQEPREVAPTSASR